MMPRRVHFLHSLRPVSRGPAGGERGVAAIEFALAFPILLVLFFGMINLAQYISTARKVAAAAELVADLVTRHENSIPKATVDDYFKSVELLLRPMSLASVQSGVGIDVYDYAMTTGQLRWSKFYQGTSARCTPPVVDTSDASDPLFSLLKDRDVVVVVACLTFQGPESRFPGMQIFTSRRIEKRMNLKPRYSETLKLT